jgi:hypothetical protein
MTNFPNKIQINFKTALGSVRQMSTYDKRGKCYKDSIQGGKEAERGAEWWSRWHRRGAFVRHPKDTIGKDSWLYPMTGSVSRAVTCQGIHVTNERKDSGNGHVDLR